MLGTMRATGDFLFTRPRLDSVASTVAAALTR
jgi:hypothetical protein